MIRNPSGTPGSLLMKHMCTTGTDTHTHKHAHTHTHTHAHSICATGLCTEHDYNALFGTSTLETHICVLTEAIGMNG